MNYTEELHELRLQVERLKRLQNVAAQLREQKEDLERRLYDLNAQLSAEARDVEQLERVNLVSLFYSVIGRKTERLDKERREEYAAKMKCDVAQRELDAVTAELDGVYREMSTLGGCTNRYEVLLKLRRDELRTSQSEAGEQLRRLEEEQAVLENRRREILEAIASGEKALSLTNDVLHQLNEARSLGHWDMFGGGMIVNLEKHEYLDSAQGLIAVLQEELRRFRRESLDIDMNVRADVHINIEGFERFADVFFDSIFHDLAVQDSIERSLSQVESVRSQLLPIMDHLCEIRSDNDRAVQEAHGRLQAFLTDADLS